MFKRKLFTASIVMIITGVALSASLIAKPSGIDIPFSPISSPSEEEALANRMDAVSSITTNFRVGLDTSPDVDFDKLRYLSLISTKHGDFVRQEKQIIFQESEIARAKRDIGPNTKQLILTMEFF
ncbi:hypothetical protein ACTHSJ_33430 [Paenibacillus cellulositrophicus]|uniref:hypothetical protein n=1 Tax=Paenibacillus cellulositrophicus TaxID=562959 RepID=UPI003F8174A4